MRCDLTDPVVTPLSAVEDALLSALRLLRPNRKRRAKSSAKMELKRIDTGEWPLAGKMLRDWLTETMKGKANLKSVRKYALAVVPDVLSWTADLDLKGMDGGEWWDLYELMLERTGSTKRRNWKADRIDNFHRFCVREYDIASLPESLTKGESADLVLVRIIPEATFLELRRRVCQKLGQDDEHREAVWVYLTLTYRCALRRVELVKFVRRDIDYGDEIWLRMRDSAFGTTKSRAFKVPAISLVLPEERGRVREYLRLHRPTPHTRLDLVFHESGLFDQIWNADTITRAVSETLEELAPGQSLVLHSGRHTGFSRLFLVAFGAAERIAQLTPYSPEHCEEIRQAVFKDTELGKDDAWCLAAFGGHGSAAVTCRNYVHTAHLAVHDQIEQMTTRWSKDLIRNLAGTTHRVVHRWTEGLDRDAEGVPVIQLANVTLDELKKFGEVVDCGPIDPIPADKTVDAEPAGTLRPSASKAIELVTEHFRPEEEKESLRRKKKRSLEQMSIDTGIPLQALYGYLDRIEIINGRATQRPRKADNSSEAASATPRHVSVARLEAGMQSPLPRRPKFRADHQYIPKLFQALEAAQRDDRAVFIELCGQYLNRMSTSASAMPLDSIEQLERFIPVLIAKIPIRRWQVIVDLPKAADDSEMLKRWQIHPRLDVVTSKQTISGAYKYPDGRARLRARSAVEKEIVKGKSIVNKFNKLKEPVSARKYSSSLLKYCLFWACVTWLETWELRELIGFERVAGEQGFLV